MTTTCSPTGAVVEALATAMYANATQACATSHPHHAWDDLPPDQQRAIRTTALDLLADTWPVLVPAVLDHYADEAWVTIPNATSWLRARADEARP